MLSVIPNSLTLLRFLLAPVVAYCMWQGFVPAWSAEFGPQAQEFGPQEVQAAQALAEKYKMWAAILFVIAALTDLFDGWAARIFDAESKFGRILDPIADKALVGLPLLTFVAMTHHAQGELNWLVLIPTLVIVGRDVFITMLRLLAPDGEGAPVSYLAKVKTTLELIAVAMPIFMALSWIGFSTPLNILWMITLWGAAILSAWTGLGYLMRPSSKSDGGA
jgi:CDP-diacylglycerol--glycerol-3-phosphate 3-phosphatidyltransferase